MRRSRHIPSLPFSKEGGAERRKVKCAARRINFCKSKESSWVNQSFLRYVTLFFQSYVNNLSSAPYGVTGSHPLEACLQKKASSDCASRIFYKCGELCIALTVTSRLYVPKALVRLRKLPHRELSLLGEGGAERRVMGRECEMSRSDTFNIWYLITQYFVLYARTKALRSTKIPTLQKFAK